MLWFFRKILDRLLVRSVLHVASELESQIHLELSDRQAEFLRKAHQLEQEQIGGLDEIVAGLRARAAKMVGEQEAPAENVVAAVALLRQENLRGDAETSSAKGCPAVSSTRRLPPDKPTAEHKKRGRPRKDAVIDATLTEVDLSVNG